MNGKNGQGLHELEAKPLSRREGKWFGIPVSRGIGNVMQTIHLQHPPSFLGHWIIPIRVNSVSLGERFIREREVEEVGDDIHAREGENVYVNSPPYGISFRTHIQHQTHP